MVGVVDASAVEVVDETQVQRGRPCFLGLPLPRSEPDPHLTVSDLYNMCIDQ